MFLSMMRASVEMENRVTREFLFSEERRRQSANRLFNSALCEGIKMDGFEFKMKQEVKIKVSGEQGEIIGRAEHKNSENQIRIRYKASDGGAVECWWPESALIAV